MDKLSILRLIVLKLQQVIALQKKLYWEKEAREICRTVGLTQELTDMVVATIWCESGMNPDAENKNKDGTTDWGICQFNDYWYGKIMPANVAKYNPRTAIELMAREAKAGKLGNWICFRSGKYKNFL